MIALYGAPTGGNHLSCSGLGCAVAISMDYTGEMLAALVIACPVYVGLDDPRLRLSRFNLSSMAWRTHALADCPLACAASRIVSTTFRAIHSWNGTSWILPGFLPMPDI